ncbi:MAG TPA: hypothetical protein VKP64_04345 [Mycobacteriales bacterium]|nr:hypothetical protein [Mycobacteriales bacterium]
MRSFAAYLRVYEPLAAFPESARIRWRAYVAGGHAADRAAGLAAEHRIARAGVLATPARVLPPPEVEGAFVTRAGGVTYVCPWDLRVRCWQALTRLHHDVPEVVANAVAPSAVAQAAERERVAWRRENPSVVPHVLTCTWRVPLPWFLLFEQGERRLVLGPRHPGAAPDIASGRVAGPSTGATGGPTGGPATDAGGRARDPARPRTAPPELTRALVYRTAMARARRRLARALAVLRRALDEGSLLAEVTELGGWLEEFHPHALVELDYGGLVHLLDDGELRGDASVTDVDDALRALADRDLDRAVEAYRRVSERWHNVAALESAN